MSLNSSRSANSGERSKRSLNSTSSNPSNNSGKKRKTGNQKTLGMAWGSNSRSSSRSSFRNSPFSDFGSYMVEKNRKLQNQFDAGASSSSHSALSSGKPIFHGVSVFVDGFTIPSSQELRGYMMRHGGHFENYFSRHRVTHIICSNLPDSKIKNLRSFSGGLPVVKPTWVLDSVAANKLLSWIPYQLDQLANETRNQPKLSAFFALKSIPVFEDAVTHTTYPLVPETEDSVFKGGTSKDAVSSEGGQYLEYTRQSSGEIDDHQCENTNETIIEKPFSNDEKSSEIKMEEQSFSNQEEECSIKNELQSSPHRPSASVSSYYLDNARKESSSTTVVGCSNKGHSTLEDPNFVENYFKYSRLHFIGTWRNRYQKRFPRLSNEFKHTSSDLNASGVSQKNVIIHMDMDCFFVSVVIRNNPELQDKPVAVCHSNNPKGTAEISSANYPARDYGVKAGIFVRDAKALCPHLVIFPYNFEAYEEAVSCDEAFLEVMDSKEGDPELLASIIRKEIFETTGCTASAGIAGNLLMARLATRSAKPNGQCYIPVDKVDDYLHQLPIKALPGIGHVLEEKLRRRKVHTCGQLRMISKESLQRDFGTKTGDMLWNYCRGVDNRVVGVIQESKSIGAEVNWGVRFNDLKDSRHFLVNLCKEVTLRLKGCGVQGRTFTLKMKKRRKDAGEPAKYMGCGDCENLSHSMTVPLATDDVDVIQRIATQLFGFFHIDVKDIRGIGLQVSRLENADTAKQGHQRISIRSWLTSAPATNEELCKTSCLVRKERAVADGEKQSTDISLGQLSNDSKRPSLQMSPSSSNNEAPLNQVSELPALCDLDMGVLESLPPELLSEINDMYAGKLSDFIRKRKGKNENVSGTMCTTSYEIYEGAINNGKQLHCSIVPIRKTPVENKVEKTLDREIATENSLLQSSEVEKVKQYKIDEIQEVSVSGAVSLNVVDPASALEKSDLMPSSLSQVDISVLQQLPKEMWVDILEQLPVHRKPEHSSSAALDPLIANAQESLCFKHTENNSKSVDSVLGNNLWIGNPPQWVDKFKVSNCLLLNILAEMYYRSGSTGCLSSILQCTLSKFLLPLDASSDGWDETISSLCDLLKQYIKIKIESDIEEIYVCFRLLKRFTMKSKLFLEAYNVVFPYLQASAGENYGGSLQLSHAKE
ncbi:DNA repair protein REV1 isoform X4 [Vitis vinifera]|uniref:DNA repair protein REV1 isoform X4 n=1 Tax=Vitis vinifera TaxID=29760 RepID=UPI0028831358|nr:DNA repair protein REV1 isoform X4 [Vitis vinifera]